MFDLQEFPDSTVLDILQKMDLATWFRCRRTGSFVFDLVQNNSRIFNFECPFAQLEFSIGNYEDGKCRTFLSDHCINQSYDRRVVEVIDPEVSLLGIRFQTLWLAEHYGENDDAAQLAASYRRFCLNGRDDQLNNTVFPFLSRLKNRIEWVQIGTRQDLDGKAVGLIGSCKLRVMQDVDSFESTPDWLNQDGLEGITHLRLFNMGDFGTLPTLLRRYEYIHGTIRFLKPVRNTQDDVNAILKSFGNELSNPRTVILEYEPFLTMEYDEGRELKGIHHKIVFDDLDVRYCLYKEQFRAPIEHLLMRVVIITEKNFFGLLIMSRSNSDGEFHSMNYCLDAVPVFDPDRAADFIIHRALRMYPIDASGLADKLKTTSDPGDVIHDFLAGYHQCTAE